MEYFGYIKSIKNGILIATLPHSDVTLGQEVLIKSTNDIYGEVIAIDADIANIMPFEHCDGVKISNRVFYKNNIAGHKISSDWLGRVFNGVGIPIDNKGAIIDGEFLKLKNKPLSVINRGRVGKKLHLGINKIDIFMPCCIGQRMGIFAGSGVGKSILMSMIIKNSFVDVVVLCLLGERSREVKEFIDDHVGPNYIGKTVIIAATSGEPALIRKRSAYLAMSVAEFFASQGLHVLCLIDSITRFAIAQREIGLLSGEPTTSKGYTPSVFSEMSSLLERAGPYGNGSITGIFTVLVESDDMNDIIPDYIRGILDGHIVMDRSIAESGNYPAINILKSVSRMLPDCNTNEENKMLQELKSYLFKYEEIKDLLNIGLYKIGTDQITDEAISKSKIIYDLVAQTKGYNNIININELYGAVNGIQ